MLTMEEEGEDAMEVTAREGREVRVERTLEQVAWRRFQTLMESRAGARRCFPVESKQMLASKEAMTPNAAAGSYRR